MNLILLIESTPEVEYDESLMDVLLDIGFPREAIKRALFYTFNQSLELATKWLMDHITDDNYADPFFPSINRSNNGMIVTYFIIYGCYLLLYDKSWFN